MNYLSGEALFIIVTNNQEELVQELKSLTHHYHHQHYNNNTEKIIEEWSQDISYPQMIKELVFREENLQQPLACFSIGYIDCFLKSCSSKLFISC